MLEALLCSAVIVLHVRSSTYSHWAVVQGYYLQAPFAVERAPTAPVPGYTGSRRFKDVRMYQLEEYPVRGLVFECGQNLPDMADFVTEVCLRLQDANIAHNMFIVDCGMRVFLYPNGFATAKAEVRHALSPVVPRLCCSSC